LSAEPCQFAFDDRLSVLAPSAARLGNRHHVGVDLSVGARGEFGRPDRFGAVQRRHQQTGAAGFDEHNALAAR